MPIKSLLVGQAFVDRCAQQDRTLTPMKLLKLVYIANGYMWAVHGRPLVDESYQASRFGPHLSSLYEAVREYRSMPVTQVVDTKGCLLDERELAIIDKVIEIYNPFTAVQLASAMTEPDTPWDIAYKWGFMSCISNDIITHFYQQVVSGKIRDRL